MREPHLCYACTPPHSLEITCNFAGIIEDAKRRTPIERYVRCSVEIIGTKRRVVGSIEAGLLVTPDSDHRALRDQLRSVLGDALAFDGGRGDADDLTQTLENFIVDRWPDRAWFVEVWNEDEALTQVYAPHGMPRWR